jgi:hypothetical protein
LVKPALDFAGGGAASWSLRVSSSAIARADCEIEDQRQLLCAVVLSVESRNAGKTRY